MWDCGLSYNKNENNICQQRQLLFDQHKMHYYYLWLAFGTDNITELNELLMSGIETWSGKLQNTITAELSSIVDTTWHTAGDNSSIFYLSDMKYSTFPISTLSKDGFGEEDWFVVRMRESIGCYWTCGESLTKTLDNKHLNQIWVPSGFRESMGLVRLTCLMS